MKKLLRKIGLNDESFKACFDYGYECICRSYTSGITELRGEEYLKNLDRREKERMEKDGLLTVKLYICLSGLRSAALEFTVIGKNRDEIMSDVYRDVFAPFGYMDEARMCLEKYYELAVPDKSISMSDFYFNLLIEKCEVGKAFEDELEDGSYMWYMRTNGDEFKIAADYCKFIDGQSTKYLRNDENETPNEKMIKKCVRVLNGHKFTHFNGYELGLGDEVSEENKVYDKELCGEYIEGELYSFDFHKKIVNEIKKFRDEKLDKDFCWKDFYYFKTMLSALGNYGFLNGNIHMSDNDFNVDIVAVEVNNGSMYVYGVYVNKEKTPMLFRSRVTEIDGKLGFGVEKSEDSDGVFGEEYEHCFTVDKTELYKMYISNKDIR
jgi:hypothetical protein